MNQNYLDSLSEQIVFSMSRCASHFIIGYSLEYENYMVNYSVIDSVLSYLDFCDALEKEITEAGYTFQPIYVGGMITLNN